MVVDAGLLAAEMLLVAFAGGALGAAIGGYAAYGLAGLVITAGEISRLALGPGGNDLLVENATASVSGAANGTASAGINATATAGINATGLIGYGPALGPHVAFAGGVAAAAFAGRKGYLATSYWYHEAKHVTTALGTRPDVLLVGGVFGVVGYWLAQLSVRFALPWDPVAASVVLSALLHRTVFGYPLIGKLGTGLLDMSPFERGDRRGGGQPSNGGQTPASGPENGQGSGPENGQGSGQQGSAGPTGRLTVEPWLPHQYRWANVAVLGAVVGTFGGFIAVATGSFALAFGIAAVALLLPVAGVDRAPIVHHMAFPAGIAALALPGADPTVAILVGGAFGLFGGVAGELAQRVFYAHADTHFDPPSASMLVTTATIAVLDVAGVFTQTVVPTGALG